jgi:hypothetical protein
LKALKKTLKCSTLELLMKICSPEVYNEKTGEGKMLGELEVGLHTLPSE